MSPTPVWLTRSLVLMAVGAILALAVTWHNRTVDVQTAGVVLLCVGAFDLVLHLAWLSRLRSGRRSDVDY
jgi:hypothetical protein